MVTVREGSYWTAKGRKASSWEVMGVMDGEVVITKDPDRGWACDTKYMSMEKFLRYYEVR